MSSSGTWQTTARNRSGRCVIMAPMSRPPLEPPWMPVREIMFRADSAGAGKRGQKEPDLVLGPTHEEVITPLVKAEITSYRDLPKTFFQIGTKFRNEIRPRYGLMRAREF